MVIQHDATSQGGAGGLKELLRRIAQATAAKQGMENELENLNETLPELIERAATATEHRNTYADRYHTAMLGLVNIAADIGEDYGRIGVLMSEIRYLTEDINTWQKRIDWLNSWFTHNDPAYHPSEAGKFQKERSDLISKRDTAKASKKTKEKEKADIERDLPNKLLARDAAKLVRDYCKYRWEHYRDLAESLNNEVKTKQKRRNELPGLIIAKEADIARLESLLEQYNLD